MKQILKNTYIQILSLYAIAVLLIVIGIINKFALQFHIVAILIPILGILALENKQKDLNFSKFLIPILFLILILRIIPYLNNSIPLGYDAGIYKYAIETSLNNIPEWMITQITMEPLFLYLASFLKLFLTSQIILTAVLIIITIILGIVIYLTTKEYFGKSVAIISTIVYAFSVIQFQAFSYMYYRNIIGITLALLSFYFIKKGNTKLFILFAVLTGAMHRPTFYLFGLSYLAFTITQIKTKNFKKYLISGIVILILTSLFYLGEFQNQILIMFDPVLQGFMQPGESPGTFIDFFTYQYSTLAYLPFALLGLFYLIKKKDFNLIFFWTIISLIIVYFQFFFFNRFIIMLDIGLIILAGIGFSILISNYKKLGIIITIILLLSAGILITSEALNTKPLISNNELDAIKYLSNTEENAYVMATYSLYSPYVLGYSNRKTIAPGLFDYDKHNQQEWINFWRTNDLNETKTFLNAYEKPLYIYIGAKQFDNIQQFSNSECFEIYYNLNNNKIYKYTC
ncbi:MAG: EpsG family protein [archaeon]